MKLSEAIKAVDTHHILLVYPIHNAPEPKSLWGSFFPKSKMRWEWDSGADNRVANLWHLREQLSRSDKVVYAKWYKGRATFFSRRAFAALFGLWKNVAPPNGASAKKILAVLEEDSPISSKILKRRLRVEFAMDNKEFERGIKELWARLLVVGRGEVDDGAFPSLAIGSTEVHFEDLAREAESLSVAESERTLLEHLGTNSPFLKEIQKIASRWERGPKPVVPVRHLSYDDLVGKSK